MAAPAKIEIGLANVITEFPTAARKGDNPDKTLLTLTPCNPLTIKLGISGSPSIIPFLSKPIFFSVQTCNLCNSSTLPLVA